MFDMAAIPLKGRVQKSVAGHAELEESDESIAHTEYAGAQKGIEGNVAQKAFADHMFEERFYAGPSLRHGGVDDERQC